MVYGVLFPRAGITPASGCHPRNGGVLAVSCKIKVSAPMEPRSASPSSSSSHVRTRRPIATKSKKAKEVPEIPTALQLSDKRRQVGKRAPRPPHRPPHTARKGRRCYRNPPKARKEGEDRSETGLCETGFARGSHISSKSNARLGGRNGAVAPGVREGAGSRLRRCSRRHRPDQGCSPSLCQQQGCDNAHQGWQGAHSLPASSCKGGAEAVGLNCSKDHSRRNTTARSMMLPGELGHLGHRRSPAQSAEQCWHASGTRGPPAALPSSRQLLARGHAAHPCP